MQFEPRGRNVHTPGGPLVASFQHMLWPRRRASEAAILVSRTFAFVFSWYQVIIAISLCLSSGALQYTVHTSIIAAKIVSLNFFFELQYFGPDLRLAWTKTAISIRSLQNADCRLQTADRVQNADQFTKCRLRIYTVFPSERDMTCHLTTYRASRNRFSAIIFHDYLH